MRVKYQSHRALLRLMYGNRADIMAALLRTASKGSGAGTVKLMHSAYISYLQTCNYTMLLQGRGFLRFDEELRTYTPTEEGRAFLDMYEEISGSIPKTESRPSRTS